MAKGWPFGAFPKRAVVGAEAVTCVEHLGKDDQFRAGFHRATDQGVGALEVRRDFKRRRGHLDRGRRDLQRGSPLSTRSTELKNDKPTKAGRGRPLNSF